MPPIVVSKDDQYVLNYCTKYLARENPDFRHNFGQFAADDPRGSICESWRFPIIDSFYDGANCESSYALNTVTFVYHDPDRTASKKIAVMGTFANLFEPLPLRPIRLEDAETGYYALSVAVPKGEWHTYKFVVDGEAVPDPVNPQRVILDNGKQWSRFFTQLCTQSLSFERWEMTLLSRLTDHILPFRTEDGERFLERFYDKLTRTGKETQFAHAYRLDQPVGVVNYIDKILAREEGHRLADYKICLDLIDRVLRRRNPYLEPELMPKEMFIDLYDQMAANNVDGWDYGRYNSPRFFLQLLRRHTFSGAFCHPKYGGNAGAAGWAYLAERYRDSGTGRTLFGWMNVIEQPLGINADYRG